MQNSLEKTDVIVSQENADHYLDQIVELDTCCFPEGSWNKDVWRGLFEHHQLQVYLGFWQNQPAGYLTLSMLSPDSEVLRLGVKEGFRRQGIGSDLLKRMIRELKNRAFKSIFLEVREDNLPACLFYQSRGFVKTGERKNYYRSPPCSAWIMNCRV
jgi:ribosomal-protein-alanine N-acetyltransferase